MVDMNVMEQFVQSLKQDTETGTTTYSATVSNIDNEGVVWVYLAGADRETPTALSSSEINVGDHVTVEWRNDKLYIAGNYSNPSAGIERVTVVENNLNTAVKDSAIAKAAADSAVESAGTAGRAASIAQAAADAALETANTKKTVFVTQPTPPYHVGDLWAKMDADLKDLVDSSGNAIVDDDGTLFQAAILQDAAAYVCLVPKLEGQEFDESDWSLATADNNLREWFWHDDLGAHVLGDETGYRNDLTSTGMKIVDTADEKSVAEFGSEGAKIGKTGKAQLEMDYHSMKLKSYTNSPYFYVSDLRDQDGNITENFTGDGTRTAFALKTQPTTVYSVKVNGTETSAYTLSSRTITFTTAPSNGASIVVKYKTDWATYAFTMGNRLGYTSPMSVSEGVNVEASAYGAHAEGASTVASGMYSHAQNQGTIAAGNWQTSIGKYNEGDSSNSYALIIGNGSDNNNRSNALTVDWNGNVSSSGDIYADGDMLATGDISINGNIFLDGDVFAEGTLSADNDVVLTDGSSLWELSKWLPYHDILNDVTDSYAAENLVMYFTYALNPNRYPVSGFIVVADALGLATTGSAVWLCRQSTSSSMDTKDVLLASSGTNYPVIGRTSQTKTAYLKWSASRTAGIRYTVYPLYNEGA